MPSSAFLKKKDIWKSVRKFSPPRRNSPAMTRLPLSGAASAKTKAVICRFSPGGRSNRRRKRSVRPFSFLKVRPAFLKTKLFRDHLAEKLAKRYALAGGEENLNSCADLLALTNDEALRGKFIAGIASAFEGAEMPKLPEALQKALNDYMAKQSGGDLTLALAQRKRRRAQKAPSNCFPMPKRRTRPASPSRRLWPNSANKRR
jgi:hypothetical protein